MIDKQKKVIIIGMMSNTTYMRVEELKPYEKNAKEHPKKQVESIARSIQEFGFNQPIVVDKDNVIIVGHGRLLAGKKLGLTEVPVMKLTNLTPEQVNAYRLADNKLNESDWDMKLVVEELRELDSAGFDIEVTGFSRDILGPDDKDDEVPEIPVTPRTQVGDLYELGDHKLLCGDSTSKADMERLFAGNKADMVFTDPPYNVDYKGSGKNTKDGILNDKMSDSAFADFLVDTFQMTKEFIKQGGGCYVFHSHKTATDFEIALEKVGFTIDTQLIWNKPNAGLGMNHYRTKHEPFYYCSLGKEKVFFGDRTGTTVWKIPERPEEQIKWLEKVMQELETGKSTVWSISRENVNEYVHPTQKPVELPARAIINSSKQGDIVLDQFLGSGTTLIACEKTNRNCYGLELDPKFADVIVQRWINFTGTTKIKKNGVEEEWTVTETK